MHAKKVLHKFLEKTCSWMHAARRNVLQVTVLAAIDERRLSVTGLGRAIDSDAKEKNCIKRADRLIGNENLHAQFREVYSSFTNLIIGSVKRPVILIDWSDLDPKKKHFLIRASVAVDGRSLSLYEEVHELSTKEKPETHRAFFSHLKKMLPTDCRPIIVTDAGFRTPWFRLVEEFEWDWVGRLRNRHLVRSREDKEWFLAKELYENASTTPKYLGQMELTRRSAIECRFVLYKGKPKGRSKTTCDGKRASSAQSEQCAHRESEPWLLVTSLPVSSKMAKKVVDIYRTRMQIEESFRDVKSIRFGIGFELNLSRSVLRLQNLLLIAMIATYVLWILGMAARQSQQHWHYQANTVKNRHVLSAIYLGLRVANDRRFEFAISELKGVTAVLQETVKIHGDGW
jgi:hypothetical protein